MVALIISIVGIVFVLILVTNQNEAEKRKETQNKVTALISSAPEFNSTRNIAISGDLVLLINDTTKQICILRPNFKKVIGFDQVIDVEYIVNEETIASKSTLNTIGRTIVGGVLAGGAGAIVGGLTGKTKMENKISKIKVKVLIRDIDIPAMNITYFDCNTLPDRKPVSPDSILCQNEIHDAQSFVNTMSVIIDEGKRMNNSLPQEQLQIPQKEYSSVADEIKRLAALKDEGILTQEEFDKQKNILLS